MHIGGSGCIEGERVCKRSVMKAWLKFDYTIEQTLVRLAPLCKRQEMCVCTNYWILHCVCYRRTARVCYERKSTYSWYLSVVFVGRMGKALVFVLAIAFRKHQCYLYEHQSKTKLKLWHFKLCGIRFWRVTFSSNTRGHSLFWLYRTVFVVHFSLSNHNWISRNLT